MSYSVSANATLAQGGVFEAIVADLRAVLRLAEGRKEKPSATIFDSRTLQSSEDKWHRAGYDGAKKTQRMQVHLAIDTLGHLLALQVTPANEQNRTQIGELAQAIQDVTGHTVEWTFVDQGYTRAMWLLKRPKSKICSWRLSSCHTPSEVSSCCCATGSSSAVSAWMTRFRRLSRDYERLPKTLAGLHLLTFSVLILHRFTFIMAHSP